MFLLMFQCREEGIQHGGGGIQLLRGKAAAELAQQPLDAAGGLQRFAAVVIPHLQAAFPFIARGGDLFDHALLGQLIDPVGGAGLGNAHLPGELGEGGALQQVDDIGSDGIGSGEPTVIDYAMAEAVQDVTPGLKKYLMLGALLGALIVCAIVVLRMLTDTTLKTVDDIDRYLHLPVLAAVPYYREMDRK